MLEPAAILGLVLTVGAGLGGAFELRRALSRRRALARMDDDPEAELEWAREHPVTLQPIPSWLPLLAAAIAAVVAQFWVSELLLLSGIATLAGVLAHIAIRARAESQALALEEGLAEAIGLTTASLRAGASPLEALERSIQGIRGPARRVLLDLVGRLRLGDSPGQAFEDLATAIPLESFRLFSVALAVQWRAGGSLERSLASVSSALRDRVELLRRIQTQSAPTRGSVFAFVAATVAIAWLMYQYDPANLERFLVSGTGSTLVGLSVWLQAIGILWMWQISRIKA